MCNNKPQQPYNSSIGVVVLSVRDEKDHRSGPKTRTGLRSESEKNEKKTRTGPDNPDKTDGLGPDQIGPDRKSPFFNHICLLF